MFHLFSSPFLLPPELFHALTLHVDTTALIAELKLALTGHVVTTISLLHPKFTLGTLLELLAPCEFQEFLVSLTHSAADLVFLAAHVRVPVHPTIEAIFLLTLQTLKPLGISFLIKEHVGAVGSRTPGTGWKQEYID